MWTFGWAVAAVLVVGSVLAVELAFAYGADVSLAWPPGTAAFLVAVAAALGVWWWPRAAYQRWRYELAESTLELERGVVVHIRTAIPYFRVQHIDITRSPIERVLGLSQLVVRTAAATTDATIPGIAAEDAEALRDVILARTGRDDV